MKTSFVENVVELEKGIAAKRGHFILFALFARENLPDRWDLVFSAPWPESPNEAIEYMVGEIKQTLGAKALTNLSRVVFVQPTDPQVQALSRTFNVEDGAAEVRDSDFFGVPIRHGYIIASRPLPLAAVG